MLCGRLRPRRDADAAARGARRSSARRSTRLALPLGALAASTARRASPRWGERLWRHPHLFGPCRVADRSLRARAPGPRPEDRHAVDQGRADERHLARRLHAGAAGLRRRRARRAADRRARGGEARRGRDRRSADPASPRVTPPQPGARRARAASRRSRTPTRPTPAIGATIDRLRSDAAGRRARRRRGRREPRPRGGARGEDAARDRRRARARLPAAARRAAGAADRRARRRSRTCSRPAPRSASPG